MEVWQVVWDSDIREYLNTQILELNEDFRMKRIYCVRNEKSSSYLRKTY